MVYLSKYHAKINKNQILQIRNNMTNTWLVLLPTIIVIVAAFTIRRLNTSLIIGVICAALIATDFSVLGSGKLIIHRLIDRLTDSEQLLTFGFLLIIGALITLLSVTGGAAAFARKISHKLKDARSAESSSVLLSFALFIDDYLSNLTVGYVMRPLTDRFKIPRTKLAYLVHSLTGPLIIIFPITSWSAMITGQLDAAGIGTNMAEQVKVLADPFYIYIKSIPFIFYSFLTIATVLFIVRKRISFGPMAKHEEIAQETGNLLGGKKDIDIKPTNTQNTQGELIDLFFPLGTLIASIIVGILYGGGFWLFGGTKGLFEALRSNPNPFLTLVLSGAITLVISILFAFIRKNIKLPQIPKICWGSAKIMYEPIVMLTLATTLGLLMREDLNTGGYLANILLGSFSIKLLPFMLFIAATISGLATGTSWGTIALLSPIAVPLVTSLAQIPTPTTIDHVMILLPVLGAIFSGAVCGDHISPISETTIMASMSSGTNPVDHTYTQLPYAIPAIICTGLAFLMTGLLSGYSEWVSIFVPLATSLAICLSMLYLLNKKKKPQQHENTKSI